MSKPVRYFRLACGLSKGAAESCAGGADRIRTDDPLLAKQVLSQLSYSPDCHGRPGTTSTREEVVGQGGFEPPTSRLSSARSNQLSY